MIAGQADNRTQREADRGKHGPRHVAKNKRHNVGKKSSGRSSTMATDEDNTPSSAIPAGSANAVLQGPLRKPTNLASANLGRRDKSSESEQPREAGCLIRPPAAVPGQPLLPQQQLQPRQHQPQQQPQFQQRVPPQPHPLQPQPQWPDGCALAVPQPGNGLRQLAPPQGMATTASHGHPWYQATSAYQGQIAHPSNYASSVIIYQCTCHMSTLRWLTVATSTMERATLAPPFPGPMFDSSNQQDSTGMATVNIKRNYHSI